MSLYSLCFLINAVLSFTNNDPSLNLPENECRRIRRPWHELSTEERDLYISGIMKLREMGNGDVMQDPFIAIASVHEDLFAPVTHKASSYLFWHGYLAWELESRIRSLGGKYSCFGMPYWDYTMESGRELNPFIFSTGLGGNGDPENQYKVNGFSWKYTTKQYWVPYNCLAEGDKYPLCSLKRALRESFLFNTAEELGQGIMSNSHFVSFAKWYNNLANPVHLFTGTPLLESPNPVITSYDPIWYLFHSMVQYHQAIWTDCNEYDLIDPDDLDNHPEAYTAFCIHGECDHPSKFKPEWMKMGLDDAMYFGGNLKQKDWSYINRNDLTVRKLYDLPRWGIVYDLGDGEGFYTKSGLKEYCKGKINKKWFILNDDEKKEENDQMMLNKVNNVNHIKNINNPTSSYLSRYLWDNSMFIIFSAAFLSIICALWTIYNKRGKSVGIGTYSEKNMLYGSV